MSIYRLDEDHVPMTKYPSTNATSKTLTNGN